MICLQIDDILQLNRSLLVAWLIYRREGFVCLDDILNSLLVITERQSAAGVGPYARELKALMEEFIVRIAIKRLGSWAENWEVPVRNDGYFLFDNNTLQAWTIGIDATKYYLS